MLEGFLSNVKTYSVGIVVTTLNGLGPRLVNIGEKCGFGVGQRSKDNDVSAGVVE